MVSVNKAVRAIATCGSAIAATIYTPEPTTLISLWSACSAKIAEIGVEIFKEKHSTHLEGYTNYSSDLFKPSKVNDDLTIKEQWNSDLDSVFLKVKEDERVIFENIRLRLGYSPSTHRIPADSLLERKPCKVELKKNTKHEFNRQEYLAEIWLYKQFRELNEPNFAFGKDAESVITLPRRRGVNW